MAFIPDEGDAMGLGNFPRYALWEEGRDVPAWSLGGRARDLPCEESGVSWSLELPAPPQSDGKSGGSRKRDILGEPKEKGEPTPPAGETCPSAVVACLSWARPPLPRPAANANAAIARAARSSWTRTAGITSAFAM